MAVRRTLRKAPRVLQTSEYPTHLENMKNLMHFEIYKKG